MSTGTSLVDNLTQGKTFRDLYAFTRNNIPLEASSKTFNTGDWYLITTTRTSSGDNAYYVNDQFIGDGGSGNRGDLRAFTLNTFTSVGGWGSESAFAEVRIFKSGMDNAKVGLLYQVVKAKWGL